MKFLLLKTIFIEWKLAQICTENSRLQLIIEERDKKIQSLEVEINNLREKMIQIENKVKLIDHLKNNGTIMFKTSYK